MNDPNLFQIQAAKGLATYPALGSVDAPHVLHNAVLRPGAWGCAPKARLRQAGVTAALYAGVEANLFVEMNGGISHYSPDGGATAIPGATGLNLTGAVTLMPDVIFKDGVYLSKSGAVPQYRAAVIPELPGEDSAVATPYFYKVPDANGIFYSDLAYTVILEPLVGPDAEYPGEWTAPTVIQLPASSATPVTRYNLAFRNINWGVNVYTDADENGTRLKYPAPSFHKAADATMKALKGQLTLTGGAITTSPVATSTGRVQITAAEYHHGRIWFTGGAAFFDPATSALPALSNEPKRLYYSDVLASLPGGRVPFFASDFYFDVPFKASSRITAIQSAGRYLYVFGDREVMILTGSDDASWTLENVGDSIGAVVASSVQRLQTSVIYLSDSGVALLNGGQSADISGEVRDLLLNLNRATITSTVDFVTEQYLITDGNTTLVYHLREQGWTTRQIDGVSQHLIYGGGTPYSVHDGALHTLDSPELLPLTLIIGPFGMPGWRRTWRGVTGAVDSDGHAAVTATLDGVDLDEMRLPAYSRGEPQERPAYPGLTPFALGLEANTAGLVTLHLTLAPDPATRRCLLRPPLTIVGQGGKEAWA